MSCNKITTNHNIDILFACHQCSNAQITNHNIIGNMGVINEINLIIKNKKKLNPRCFKK